MPPKPTKPYLSAFRNDLMEGQVVVVTGALFSSGGESLTCAD